ncbi:MAG: class I SAM-dependent RNA methyltransferase [Clostridia bacterium]|nr:class I SAM-dependent RNA methyltransferase [Clostridia bacterium]
MNYTICVTSAFGVEAATKRELERLGITGVRAENGKILFQGTAATVAACNLYLRTANKVFIVLGTFSATSFDELFGGVYAIPFEDFIPVSASIPVTGKTARSDLFAYSACQSIIKKAICKRLMEKRRVLTLPETGARYGVEFFFYRNECMICLNTSGDGLHRRGYRTLVGEAPLKETLAAALLDFSVWNPQKTLVDPFCGSGTIAIEAARIACNIPAGMDREFDFTAWGEEFSSPLLQEKERAAAAINYSAAPDIQGYDIEDSQILLARAHAKAAGVADKIHFQRRDMRALSSHAKYGVVVTNPPYGKRLAEGAEVISLMRDYGKVAQTLPTWSFYTITSFLDFERCFGKKAEKKRKLFNGNLECCYYQMPGPRPPQKPREENR